MRVATKRPVPPLKRVAGEATSSALRPGIVRKRTANSCISAESQVRKRLSSALSVDRNFQSIHESGVSYQEVEEDASHAEVPAKRVTRCGYY